MYFQITATNLNINNLWHKDLSLRPYTSFHARSMLTKESHSVRPLMSACY